ncbi:PAS domain S-box protein [Hydrogenophaga sp.]|uniref:PAS domain S-box protein n=1 Tax=Hydrogenophaga sp. TaxID=1904254 RepID=UPI0025C2C0E2|nr:PAS domain S-box protein [Hydrogenophaga sp.]MBT9465888.1 PAS domain S-box protein [Hydrogenophaga sp.]
MKLSYKAWALVFVTVGVCSLLAVMGARWIMSASFTNLETQAAFAEGERASRLVNQQLRGLAAQVRSAAYSADMVSYAAGSRSNELNNLFDVTKMSDMGLSGVVVFDKAGRYVGSVASGQMGWSDQLDPNLIDQLRPLTGSVFGDSNAGATLQTLLPWNKRLYMVAIAAILDPALSNEPSGAMVMVRDFSSAEVLSLANVLLRPISLTLEPPPLSALHTRLQIIDDQNIDLFTPLSNSEGVHVAQLILRLDRPLRVGQIQLSQAGLVLAGVAGLIASLLLSVLLYRLVLRRMLNLYEDLKAVIERGPTVGGTVRASGNDELSRLAHRTNQLLERVRQDAMLQQQAYERQDALQGQLMQALSEAESHKQELDFLARVARETTNAVILTGPEGLIEWINEGFTRITGYTLEESVGRTPGKLLQCPETDPQTVAHIREALALRQPCKAEILNRGKDGRLYWLELEITPLFDESGLHTGFMAIESDVTDRHETLERLKGAVQENESLMKAINQGTIYSVADLQGNILDLNEEFVRISGYEREELIGSNHRLLKSGTQSSEFWANAWATISSGQIWRGEVCNRSKRGQLYWVDSTIVPFVGIDGMVEKYISIRTDVTEQKRAQIELESQRKRLDNILKGTQAGTWEWHVPSGHIIFNERWAEILGYTTEELEPTTIDTWMSLVHADDTGASDEAMRQHFNGELDFYKAEFRMRHSSGRWIWVQARGQLASREPDGSPGWMYGTNIDITQQKAQADALLAAKDQAEQASLFKSQFLANMSHEIRTPMNAILGMLTLMHKTPLQPRQLDYVVKTEGAAKSLLGLLNDILDLSKVEAGKMTLDPQPFDLDRLMRDLSVIFSTSLGNKPVEVLFDIDPRVPRHLLGDSLRLQQILINLGGNAIKFTSHGEIVLQVHLESLEGNTPQQYARVHFSVKDSGIGIAPENQHKIFAGFTQAEASTTRRFGGTGLGLSISRRLIELMGGELRLESVEGSGSTFSFNVMLPVVETASNTGAGTRDTQADMVPWCIPGLAVLVVDDNPVARELMARMGESLGWRIDTAESGEAALAHIASRNARGEPYRAVFVDWMMPGLDGWQTSARIRSLVDGSNDSTASPVVMMVTAHGREMLAQQTTEVQSLIDGYLVKPVTASMLLEALQLAVQPNAVSANVRSTARVVQPLKGLRILLVEDNAINQQVAEELLSGQGAAVDIADNGLRGVEAVQAAMASGKPYNAVLMDMQMPVMDGLTAAIEIRGRLGVRSLPIIAMTANAMASDREACLNAGMNDHIGKPFNLDQLVATLLQWTRGAAAAEASEAPMPYATREIALLNRTDALQRMGGSTSLLNRLSTQFLADLPKYLDACEPTMLDGQHKPAQRALHSLKGVAATIGADALAKVAGEEEQHARSGATVNLEQLRQTAARTEQALLEIGVAASLVPASEEAADDKVQPELTTAQRELLKRLLPFLEAADLSAIEAMEELLAHGDGDNKRWAALDREVQALEFDLAADRVRQSLDRE